jgi:hypothetical protein
VIGGVVGSLLGFTLSNLGGAFVGGLIGIGLGLSLAWFAFKPRRPKEAAASPGK